MNNQSHFFSRMSAMGYLPFLVAFGGVVFTALGFSVMTSLHDEKLQQAMLVDANSHIRAIEAEVESHFEVLRVLKGHFDASPDVDREEFRVFVTDILSRHPSIQALEWIPKVERSEVARYTEMARGDNLPSFAFTERSADGALVPVGPRANYLPVYFLEPLTGNEAALGFDLGSNERRLAALQLAAARAELSVTAPITLVQENQAQVGVLLIHPLYGSSQPVSRAGETSDVLQGYVTMALRIGDAMTHALLYEPENVDVQIQDVTDPENAEPLFGDALQAAQSAATYSKTLDIGGRQWEISASPQVAAYVDGASWLPLLVLLAGLSGTAFISVLFFVLLGRRREVEALVDLRTDEVRELLQRQEQIFEHAGDGVFGLDGSGRTIFANKAATRMLGYSLEEMEGVSQHELIHHHHGDGREFLKEDCKIQETLRQGIENKENGEVFWRKDGSSFPVEYTSSAVRDEEGNLSGAVIVFRDITERTIREAQENLVREVAIISNDAASPDELMSKALAEVAEFIGWPVADVLYVSDEEGHLVPSGCWHLSADVAASMREFPAQSDVAILENGSEAISQALEERTRVWIANLQNHTELTRSDLFAQHGLMSSFAFPIFDNERVLAVFEFFNTRLTMQDDTILKLMDTLSSLLGRALERMSAELELTQANRFLEQTNAELDTFAYIASHDLRAPLRGMDTVAKWIEEDLDDGNKDDIRTNLSLLRGRVARMEQLLADILSYARAGKRESEPEMVDVRSMLLEVVKWVDAPDGFEIKIQETLPTLFISKTLLEQVFLNLLSNGIKHHDRDQGVIEVLYKVEDGHHEFIVRDDGPGIPPRFQDRVFTMFNTLKPRDDVEGSGIGLAIVKKMVVTSLGQVDIESPLTDRGCKFHVKLPLSLPKNQEKRVESHVAAGKSNQSSVGGRR